MPTTTARCFLRMQEDHVDRVRARGERVLARPSVRSDREDRDRAAAGGIRRVAAVRPSEHDAGRAGGRGAGARRSIRSSSPRPRRGARPPRPRPTGHFGPPRAVVPDHLERHDPPRAAHALEEVLPVRPEDHRLRAGRDRREPHVAHEQHGGAFPIQQDPGRDPRRPGFDPFESIPARSRREQPSASPPIPALHGRILRTRPRSARLPVRRIEEPFRVQLREHLLGGRAPPRRSPADVAGRSAAETSHELPRAVREAERGVVGDTTSPCSFVPPPPAALRRRVVPREDDDDERRSPAAARVRHR